MFPDDAEDIRAHRWFKNFPWDRINDINPPFVPRITSLEDTHYFDESDARSELMASCKSDELKTRPEDVRWMLRDCRPAVQNMAIDLIATPYDSLRLRSADRRIDKSSSLTAEEKKVLKTFLHTYGKKERKRPRDILLRDRATKKVAMRVRRETAFLGYTWSRMRPGGYVRPNSATHEDIGS